MYTYWPHILIVLQNAEKTVQRRGQRSQTAFKRLKRRLLPDTFSTPAEWDVKFNISAVQRLHLVFVSGTNKAWLFCITTCSSPFLIKLRSDCLKRTCFQSIKEHQKIGMTTWILLVYLNKPYLKYLQPKLYLNMYNWHMMPPPDFLW